MENKEKEFFTRKDYMQGLCSHREFYSQFVTDQIKAIVLSGIGKDSIISSTDEHLNDIPLKKWDSLNYAIKSTDKTLWKKATNSDSMDSHFFVWSLSDSLCIAKEAAKQIKEG